jgi:quercetin dioxygenase-like cupin family protein
MNRSFAPLLGACALLLSSGIPTLPQPSQRVPQFENDEVNVWRTTVMPNAPLAMHRHDHARVIVALQGGVIKIVPGAGPAETHRWETGAAYWLPANPPNQLHADVNAGDKPLEVMVVELKRTR